MASMASYALNPRLDDKTTRQQDNNSGGGGKTLSYEAAQLMHSLKITIVLK
jgi:hypothetical protein